MADFTTTKLPSGNGPTNLGTTGTHSQGRRLLGDDGAGAVGRGEWFENTGLWKTFFLYNADRTGAVNATVDVRIEACMELASSPDDPDVDTQVVELAALTAASPNFSTEHPWRYVRARVEAHAGAKNVQVGFLMQGQG